MVFGGSYSYNLEILNGTEWEVMELPITGSSYYNKNAMIQLPCPIN